MSMSETKFRFEQMKLKMFFGNVLKFHQTMFSATLKSFDAVYGITFGIRKFVIPMIDTKMLLVTKVDQPHNIHTNHHCELSINIGMTSNNPL